MKLELAALLLAACAAPDRWHTSVGYQPERDGTLGTDPNWSTQLEDTWTAEVGVSGSLLPAAPRPAGVDTISSAEAARLRTLISDQRARIEALEAADDVASDPTLDETAERGGIVGWVGGSVTIVTVVAALVFAIIKWRASGDTA